MSNGARRLETSDVPQALALSRAAGWNQTEEDWRRAIELGRGGCFAMEWEGAPIATATSICYGGELAWIGMVLTHAEFRGRGFARALMEQTLDHLDRREIRTVKLDATDMGAPLYRKLGFVDECVVERWLRPAGPFPDATASAYAANPGLDREAFGADRGELLARLSVIESASIPAEAFAMGRTGLSWTYFGPCVSRTSVAADALVRWFLARHLNEVVCWDLLPENTASADLARALGFNLARRLTRMSRGGALRSDSSLLYAAAGFEFG